MKSKRDYLKMFFFVLLVILAPLIPYCQLEAKESLSIEVQPVGEDKVWNTTIPRDQNPNGMTDTYYYPWAGDDSVTIKGFQFINLTEKKSRLIEQYGITVSCDLDHDIQSAVTDMNFLGQHPVSIVWNTRPVLHIEKAEQAEADGYIFVMKLKDGICNVVDNGEVRITKEDWNNYYEKAKESCNIILKWQENRGSFGSKENPGYGLGSSDIWCIFSAARCGYVPFDDPTWFDRWFLNTKKYVEEKGSKYFDQMSSTDLSKLILAIEALGYDPRDIEGMDLLEIEGKRNSQNNYREEYAIHSIKSGGYSTGSFSDEEMEAWVHKRAKGLKETRDETFKNADNSMGWQPLIYWYGKEGFEDVTEAVDSAVPRLATIAQRATGAICTEGYETGCPMYGNNAWNDAQALLFAGEFGCNVIRPESGFTKNGNNILDAVFALIDYEDGTIPGFDNYDPAQITRGLNSFVREYERDVLGKDTPPFWIFSDVKVPSKPVYDAIAALNGKSTDQDIADARAAYQALDDAHKDIFNREYLDRLEYFESGGRVIEAAREAITAIPALSDITLSDKEKVKEARQAYDALSEENKALIGDDLKDKLVKAEERLVALKEEAAKQKEAEGSTQKPGNKTATLKKGKTFASGKNKYKLTKISGKKGEVTFTGCKNKNLSKVIIPATVTYKGYTLKVTAIGPKALKGYKKLTALTIGNNVKTIGSGACAKCPRLKKITVKSSVLKKIEAGALSGIHKKAVIKVPKKKRKAYKKLFKGKGQKKTVRIK